MKKIALLIVIVAVFFVGVYIGEKRLIQPYLFGEDSVEKTDETSEMSVDLLIDYGNGEKSDLTNVTVTAGATVFEALKKASESNGIELSYEDYGGDLGILVTSIGEVKNDVDSNIFWQYRVNSQHANVGAASFNLEEGDQIEWRYEESQF